MYNKKTRNLIIFVLMLGSFLTALTQTVLTSALPSIMSEFSVTADVGQWLTTIYMLVLGIMIPATAYLINTFSTKKLFLFSMGLFFIGCLLSIFSNSFSIIVLSRALQAVGAGISMQLVQVSMINLYPLEERGKAMGLYGFVVGVAPTVGPITAGYIIDSLGWRIIFYLLGFIALVDIIIAFLFLRNIVETKKSKLEIISLGLSTLGFGGLLLGISNISNYGMKSPIVYMPIIIGIISLLAFIIRQFKVELPLLQLKVFKNTNFTISTILVMIIYAVMTAATMLISIYVQSIRGYSAVTSGLLMLPGSILMAILCPITGRILDKYGARFLSISGFIFLGVGTYSFANLDENTSLTLLTVMFCFRMIGIAFLLMTITTWGLNSLRQEDIPHGSAISSTLRQVSGAIGSSIFIALMTSVTKHSVNISMKMASINGMNTSFAAAAAVAFIGVIASIIYVKDKRDNSDIDDILEEDSNNTIAY